MSNNPAESRFFATMPLAALQGPINGQAIQRDAGLVLARARSLLGYQQYLAQARSWKAQAKALPDGFEREVQVQAAGALTDTHSLASAVLRMTSQFKQAGELDRLLAGWIATLGQSGPVQAAALVDDLQNQVDPQVLKDEGVTDDLWSSLVANLKNIDGTLFVQDGALAAQLTVPGQDKPRNVTFAPSATGMPQTLSDLLQRGSFERLGALFVQDSGAKLHLLPGPERGVELADVVLSGSILSVRSMAEHSRGLQDVGLAKYAGSAVVIIWAVAALTALAVGYILAKDYCKDQPIASSPSTACKIGALLIILGLLALIVGFILLSGRPNSNTQSESACVTGRIFFDAVALGWLCDLTSHFPQ